ncbi:AsmA-like C-terminal region-containing protein [Microbulbifer sp. S227A]|uniref:YhdP family protein n=1 Tax=Microbulbifer sp. S227A TaxID=3415131 RepID=UPI003C79C06D
MTTEPKNNASDEVEQPRRRSRRRRVGIWSAWCSGIVALLVGGLVLWGIGQTLTMPDWLRHRIETRIEQNLGGLQIAFGDVEMVVNRGWRPRVRLRDVVLSEADGRPVVQLADAQASLAMRPLLRGRLQPKSISLAGAFITLRRETDGKLSLALGQDNTVVREATTVAELIEEWDRRLTSPPLSSLVAVEMEALTLRYDDLRQGRSWTLDGGRITLDRDDADIRIASSFSLLSGGDSAGSIEMNYVSRIGQANAELGVAVSNIPAQDIAAQSVALAWLDVLRAPISGALRGSIQSDGALGPLSATLQIGAGVVQPTEATRPVPFDDARSYFTYDPREQVLIFDEVSVQSAWGSGAAEGRAYLGIDSGGFSDLIGQLTLTDLSLNPDGLYEEPVEIARTSADFRLQLAPFRMTLGDMFITQQDSRLHLSGRLDAHPEGWKLAVDGSMDRLTPERLKQLWPDFAAPKPRKWVNENVSGGWLEDIGFALRIDPGERPDIYLDFSYEDTEIKFLKTMPPIMGAAGQVTIADDRFVATATAGRVVAGQGGALDVAGTSFIIPQMAVKPDTPAVVRVQAGGSVTSILSLLNRPPLAVLKDTPLPVDMADGSARLTGTLALPMKPKVPFEELEFHLRGTISDVTSTVLVPGQTVQAQVMDITGDQDGIALSGAGRIGPVPVSVRWQQPLGKDVPKGSRLDGTIELSPAVVDTFGIGLPDGSVSGSGSATFSMQFAAGSPPALTLESDLRGVGLALPPLGWAKPAPAAGRLQIAGIVGDQTRIDRLVLEAAGLSANGAVSNRPGGGLDRALLSSVRLGGWLDAAVELVGRGSAPPDIRVLSGTLDLRKASFGSGSAGGESGRMEVALDRLQITDTISLTEFSGQFTTTGGVKGPFTGRVNGDTRVSGQVQPQSGRSAVRIQSGDAGGVVRSAGLLTMARGGQFDMSLRPGVRSGQFDGTLKITDTQVHDAPAIAALLNAISVVGLLDEMSGQGIQFSDVEARFRLGPSRVTVFESSATGPAMGLSMDGTFDVPRGTLNMQGVISPLYLLNQVGNLIARKGEGVFGFNYTLTGPARNPRVRVNPFSGIAPGFLRDIMRRAPPPVDEFAPKPAPAPRKSPNDADWGR